MTVWFDCHFRRIHALATFSVVYDFARRGSSSPATNLDATAAISTPSLTGSILLFAVTFAVIIMLGSRTKKVICYGKRSQRVVNSAEKASVFSPFLDTDPTPKLSPLKPMKNRENILHKRRLSSPKVVIPVRKRSPVTKALPKRLPKVSPGASFSNASAKEKSVRGTSSLFKPKHPLTPTRTPLASYHPNMPGSPAVPPKHRPKRASPLRKASNVPKKLFSPYTEVDIVVVDDDGRTVKREMRRVSTTSKALATDSDDETPPATKPTRRLKSRAIVISDDSDSDSGNLDIIVGQRAKPPVGPSAPRKRKQSPKTKPTALPDAVECIDLTDHCDHDTLIGNSTSKRVAPQSQEPTRQHRPLRHGGSSVFRRYTTSPHPLPDALSAYDDVVVRPRQLTPVRPGRSRLFAPPSPASTCSSGDLEEFANQWGDEGLPPSDDEAPDFPEYLRPLLRECDQDNKGMYEFSAFLSTFPFDPVLSPAARASSSKLRFRKVGEASYSEVFGIGDVVLKIIPIRDESVGTNTGKKMASSSSTPYAGADAPAPSDARDVLKEIIVTKAMGDVHEGFVKLLKTYVVKGRYPEELLELWDEYYTCKGSESIRPDAFALSQVYAILVLPNGGPDLESYSFKSPTKSGWRHASSIFWQVTKALAHAEQLVSFEHRDLHLGQILVNDRAVPKTVPLQVQTQNRKVSKHVNIASMDDPEHGVAVTLIDLGLSRMDAGDGCGGEMIHWTPFEDEVFQGEGDYQFDIYRMMRDQNVERWEAFKPITNVMWLHYLLVKLLKCKGLRAPRKNLATSSSAFGERECYDCLVDLEQWLGQCVVAAAAKVNKPVKGKGRRKTTVIPMSDDASLSPLCAGEVLEYGMKKQWVKAISS